MKKHYSIFLFISICLAQWAAAQTLTYNKNNYDIAEASFNSVALSVGAQEGNPIDMLFNNDGSVLYVLGATGDDINQYNLSTNYDISTATFNSIALSVGAQEVNPRVMLFNNDGSVLYVMGTTGDDINQYNLSANYDISSAVWNSVALSVQAQETTPVAMIFNNDGSVLYVLGDNGDDINQYNLSANYDISTAVWNSVALSVQAQETGPFSMIFNNDGSVLYVMGNIGDDINQYNLTTNYDISTATFNSIALSVQAQETFPTAMLFNNDGSVLYVMGISGQDINQYNIISNYSEATANNGTIDNTSKLIITLSGDTYTGTNGSDLVADTKVSIGNVPTGLTAVLTKDSDTQVSLTFTGSATSHQSANNIADLTFAFADTAFTTTAATSVVNSGAASPFSSNVGIDFLDNTATVEFSVDTADNENVGANLPQLLVTGTVTATTTVTVTNAGTGSTNTGDYTFASPVTVTIPAGSYDGTTATAVSITGLSITGDTNFETDETIDFTLSSPTGDVIIGDVNSDSTTDISLTYTITNDDVAPELTYNKNNYDIAEASFNQIALSVGAQDTSPYSMLFNNDGSVLYVLGTAGDDIYQYNLSTNYDISTATFNSIALSVGAQETFPTAMLFNNDGSVLYVMGTIGDDINQYNLSSNYDISTATFNSIALFVGAQEASPTAMLFNSDGSVLYVMGTAGDDINQYNLSANYDISTATFNSIALSVLAQDYFPTAMLFNNDGGVLYVLGRIGDDINQYNISSNYPEAVANNGTIDNTNVFTITLSGDTFTGVNGSNLVADAKVSIGNVPTGLTAVLTKDSDTQVSLSFTGTATSHQSANNVVDLTFAFANTAFTTTAATSVVNSGAASAFSSNVGIDFLDNTTTWTGSTDTDWNTAGNWSDGIPTSLSIVSIPNVTNKPIVSSETTAVVDNLTIDASSSLVINTGGNLTISGNLVNNGTFTINSDATKSGSLIVTGTSTGNITYNRYLESATSTKWHLIAAPVGSYSINTFATTGANNVATSGVEYSVTPYDNTGTLGSTTWNHWTSDGTGAGNISGAGNFIAGKGYEILTTADGTVAFTGTVPVAQVSIAVTVSGTNAWNLIGNPFPSSIPANSNADGTNNFITVNTADMDASFQSLYLWDPGTSSYDIVNQAAASTYIAPGQAFFVKSVSGGSTVNFTTAMRSNQSAVAFQRIATTTPPSITLIADDNSGKTSTTAIKYIAGTSLGLDPGFDAGRFGGTSNSFEIYSKLVNDNGIDFSLQVVPDTDYDTTIISIGLDADSGTQITFKAQATDLPTGKKVFLEDRLLGSFTELNATDKTYTLTLASQEQGVGRFFLRTQDNAATLATSDLDKLRFTVIAQSKSNIIRVIGNVEGTATLDIYDTLGRFIYTTTLKAQTENEVTIPSIAKGVYFIKIKTANSNYSTKIAWY